MSNQTPDQGKTTEKTTVGTDLPSGGKVEKTVEKTSEAAGDDNGGVGSDDSEN